MEAARYRRDPADAKKPPSWFETGRVALSSSVTNVL
jgi:hypothetical protein